jgi:hypothetical protein
LTAKILKGKKRMISWLYSIIFKKNIKREMTYNLKLGSVISNNIYLNYETKDFKGYLIDIISFKSTLFLEINMTNKILNLLILFLLPVSIFSQDFKLLSPAILNLGDVPSDTLALGEIRFMNHGSTPMSIKRVETSCGCTVANLDKLTYNPGEEGKISVHFNTKGYSGLTRKTVTIYLEKGTPSSVRIVLQVKVTPKMEITPQFINFQQVNLKNKVIKRSFEIKNNTKSILEATIGKIPKENIDIEPKKFSIQPNGTQKIDITYNPEKLGRDDSTVLVQIMNQKLV